MASHITYEKGTYDHEQNKIGGSSFLPKEIVWPLDRHGNKMLFVASISSEMLQSQCSITIPSGQVLSIFCPYKKDDIEYGIDIARSRENGFLIAHFPGAARQEFEDPISEAKKLELNLTFETDEDEFSEDIDDKIGGQPNWLQDRFNYSGYDFVMQISGLCLRKIIPSHNTIFMGGVLYLFYDPLNNKGVLTLQYS